MSRCVVFPSPCFMGKWGAECENPSSPVLLIFLCLSVTGKIEMYEKVASSKIYSGNVASPLFLNPVWNPTLFFLIRFGKVRNHF